MKFRRCWGAGSARSRAACSGPAWPCVMNSSEGARAVNKSHDILDSALAMLRDQAWPGPAVNPALERAFGSAAAAPRRQGLRLVLGVGAVLVGCGAVAAARPAWRAIFGPPEIKPLAAIE